MARGKQSTLKLCKIPSCSHDVIWPCLPPQACLQPSRASYRCFIGVGTAAGTGVQTSLSKEMLEKQEPVNLQMGSTATAVLKLHLGSTDFFFFFPASAKLLMSFPLENCWIRATEGKKSLLYLGKDSGKNSNSLFLRLLLKCCVGFTICLQRPSRLHPPV